jgi:phosphate transport system protein
MPRTEYRAQLEVLRTDVVAMGEAVLDQYDRALEACERGDAELAESVIESDREINERYLALERECIDLFALQQPVASDLRFVASSFKIVTDLERIADLATNIAHRPLPPTDAVGDVDVRGVAEEARAMVADALAAYATDDVAACWRIAERDTDLDRACENASETVVGALLSADPAGEASLQTTASRLLVLLRDVERVGDHAVNVAARTLYMAEHDDSLLF